MPPEEFSGNTMNAMEQLGRALCKFAEATANAVIEITEVIASIITIATMPIMPTMGATNKKWLHLYKYSKKVRTRKKYQKKIIEEFAKMLKEGG